MGSILLMAITIIGFLIIIGVIPYQRFGGILIAIIVAGLFLPMVFPHVFFEGGSPWWKYALFVVALLVGIRMILDRIFPWRRRY